MDAENIRDLFRDFGPVDIRRMFGGVGVFVDGLMIALVTSDDVIYLKADGGTVPAFEKEGLSPFSYATKNGEHTLTSYWRMPDRLCDDPEELARWARDAHAVALRKAAAKPRPRPRPAKPRPAKRELGAAKRALRPAKRARPPAPAKRAVGPAKRAKKKH
jgi:DNA transformation protein and related proteins